MQINKLNIVIINIDIYKRKKKQKNYGYYTSSHRTSHIKINKYYNKKTKSKEEPQENKATTMTTQVASRHTIHIKVHK